MSTTTPQTLDPSNSSSARQPRALRSRVVVTGLVGAVLLGAAIALGVYGSDAAALGRAKVFLDARSITCANPADVTTVARGDAGPTDSSYSVPAVRGSSDLDCRLSVIVQNDSARTLDVDRVTFTLLGRESAVGLRTDYAFTQGLRPSSGGDPADVVYDFADDPANRAPIPVSPGSSQRFDFHLVSDGCRQAGASTTWPDSPTFTATIGIATRDLPLESPGFGFIGVRTAKQPCH